MKRALFIHVYTASHQSINFLRSNNINPVAFSLPNFVPPGSSVRKCLEELNIQVFNIDSLNYISNCNFFSIEEFNIFAKYAFSYPYLGTSFL